MAVLETDSSILQMERTRLGGPANVFKGRAAIQAGGMGRQDPYELSKEKRKVLRALAMTRGWELTDWGETKFHMSQP